MLLGRSWIVPVRCEKRLQIKDSDALDTSLKVNNSLSDIASEKDLVGQHMCAVQNGASKASTFNNDIDCGTTIA